MQPTFKLPFYLIGILILLTSLLGGAVAVTPAYAAGTITVTNANDSGTGSLRDAISNASAGDTINFDNDYTITLTSGELDISRDLTITGAGHHVTVSGNNAARVFVINSGSTTIDQLTIANGYSPQGEGGGIDNFSTLTVTSSAFSGNSAGSGSISLGGGLGNSGTATVTNSTFSGNYAGYAGGGIENLGTMTVSGSTFSGNSSGGGGGIYNVGTLTVTGSTFSANSAIGTSGLDGAGGGILSNAALTVTNSTFSGNSATGTSPLIGIGGGIYEDNGGTAAVTNSTFSGNSATAGGSIYMDSVGISGTATTVKNTIVANSAGGNCGLTGPAAIGGLNNLADDNTCGSAFTQATSSAMNLGALSNNGGPTQTIPLLAGSAAIDAGDNTTCQAAPVNNLDQRGVTRITNSDPTCDIGAFEFQGTPPAITSLNSATFTVGSNGSFTVMATGVPTPAISETGTLPSGVTFTDNGDGTATLSGTPAAGAGGSYALSIRAGNGVSPDATQSFTLKVLYSFTGFLSPVMNPPSLNLVNSGSSVPLKFSLAGNQGLSVFAVGYPASQPISCTTLLPSGSPLSTSPSGSSGLTYNSTTNTYTYSWKTVSSWKGTCRQFIVTLTDGTTHSADFKFK